MSHLPKTTPSLPAALLPTAPPMPAVHPVSGRSRSAAHSTAFGRPRDFLGNRFIYLTVSARARGLSVGVNLNPDRLCNFDCAYCDVDRRLPLPGQTLDVDAMAEELQHTLDLVISGRIHDHPAYRSLPRELLVLRHVALSGDGEPTLCSNFSDAVEAVVHVRARGTFPFFKIVLLTNATGLDTPAVDLSLKLLTDADEIWAKLDAGTQSFMDRVNNPQVPLKHILANILTLGRQRPVIIQSMFLALNGQGPTAEELAEYLARLNELKSAGANIPLVQVYSPTRPMARAECGHLPLKNLSDIAKLIRSSTGLPAEVF